MGDATARPRQAPFFALFASTIQQHRSGNAVPIDVVEMRGLGRSDSGYSQGTPMTRTHVAAIAVVVSIGLAASTAQAQSPTEQGRACIGKGGRGTGSSVEDARFQAWEAVLQATSWPMWAAWMTSGATVGQAPLPGTRCARSASAAAMVALWAKSVSSAPSSARRVDPARRLGHQKPAVVPMSWPRLVSTGGV